MANQNWAVEKIVTLLNTNNLAVERGIVAIYNRQTLDEKRVQHTIHNNKIGFSAPDGKKGTYFARWILSGRNLTGHHLMAARRLAIKYRAQLLNIALEEKPTVAVKPVVVAKPVAKKIVFKAKKPAAKPVRCSCRVCVAKNRPAPVKVAKPVVAKVTPAMPGREICNVCQIMKCPDGCCCGC
jgi:hypothetical protein